MTLSCSDTENGPAEPADIELDAISADRWLLHVNGRSASDIYVVGGTPDDGFLSRYDGNSWQDAELPEEARLLNWVHLFDDGSAVTVGNEGTILTSEDGEIWNTVEPITDEDLWGVWGSSSDDVWAVGGRGRPESEATILRRQNGEWASVDVPELERPGVRAFFKVWGTDSQNVLIVGQNGIVLRWNGTSLAEEGVGTSDDLISLDGTGPDNIVVVGGRGNAVVARYDGSEWNSESLAPAPGLNGIYMTSETDAWIAGASGLLRQLEIVDGSFTAERVPPRSEVDLHAVAFFDELGALAVGGNFSSG